MMVTRRRLAKSLGIVAIALALILAIGCGGSASTSGRDTGSSSGKTGVEKGQEIFKSAKLGCTNCHKVNGQGGAVGPDLSHIATTAAQRKAGMSAEDYIKESLKNPGAFLAPSYQNMMTKYDLPDQEMSDLVSYLVTLK